MRSGNARPAIIHDCWTRTAQRRWLLPPRVVNRKERSKTTFLAMAAAVMAALPLTAHAQGAIRGAEDGAAAGDRAAGPVGAIVGGAVGAAAGTVEAIMGVEDRPRFRDYVVREHRPSYRFHEELHVGAVLPERGVTLYEVPREYHIKGGYGYAVVNDRPVIVELRSRRIVEIIE
jgi:hypothetical protein